MALRLPIARCAWLRVLALGVALCSATSAFCAEQPHGSLAGVEWDGVRALPISELEEVLSTPPRPAWQIWNPLPSLDPGSLDGDLERVVALYREHGYYEATASYALEWNAAHDAATLHVQVREGTPVLLESWHVDFSEMTGGDQRWSARLGNDLPLREGEIFTIERYGAAKRLLLDRLANEGFPDAIIAGGGDVDLDTQRATVRWQVQPGPRLRFGAVRIEGLQDVSESLVREQLEIVEGERYSETEVQKSRQQVADLGLFRSITLTPDLEGDEASGANERSFVLRVDERPLRSVRAGLGYGTEDRVRVQAGWTHRNFFGRADPLDVRARYSSLGSDLSATLREPRVPDRRTSLQIGAHLRNETLPAYDAVDVGGSVAVELPLRLGWSWRAGYNLDWTSVVKVPTEAERIEDDPQGRFLLSYFDLGVRRITTDDLLEPTRGTWFEVALEPSSRAIGSDVDYLRGSVDARVFHPLGTGVVAAARALFGTIDAFGSTSVSELPVTKLFYAGGSSTVRGYDYQRLGPTNIEGEPVGGASLLVASLELRFPILGDLRGIVFTDAGQVSLDAWDWRPADLQYAVGPGLRYATPLGPIRLDVGFPIDPPENAKRVRFWLSIGQAF
jgi:outer membrane protein assembly complex protein YaeT